MINDQEKLAIKNALYPKRGGDADHIFSDPVSHFKMIRAHLPVYARLDYGISTIQFTKEGRIPELALQDAFLIQGIVIRGAASKTMSRKNWESVVFGIFSLKANDRTLIQNCPIRHLCTRRVFPLIPPIVIAGWNNNNIRIDMPMSSKVERSRVITLWLSGYLIQNATVIL